MAIKKTKNGFLLDIYPNGRGGARVRKTFTTQAEAKRYAAYVLRETANGKQWNARPEHDARRLIDLLADFQKLHGAQLKRDFVTRVIEDVAHFCNNPLAVDFKAADMMRYMNYRLAKGCKPTTVNLDLAAVKLLFNKLIMLDNYGGTNPVGKLRRIKIPEKQAFFLSSEDIEKLLKAAADFDYKYYLLIVLGLSTGGRWSELNTLKKSALIKNKVLFTQTKTKKNRAIPISAELFQQLQDLPAAADGSIFKLSVHHFKNIATAGGVVLQKGQATHVMRHTFASHFMMNGGNILTLQKILGHASITMTMTYAHLAPEYLEAATTLNPVANVGKK